MSMTTAISEPRRDGKVIGVIEGALERLRDGVEWTKGVDLAADCRGNPVLPSDPLAFAWTLAGALAVEAPDRLTLRRAAISVLLETGDCCQCGHPTLRDHLECWNDLATHDQVVRLLEGALGTERRLKP